MRVLKLIFSVGLALGFCLSISTLARFAYYQIACAIAQGFEISPCDRVFIVIYPYAAHTLLFEAFLIGWVLWVVYLMIKAK